MFSLLLQK